MSDIIHQAAIIPYRINDEGYIEIALITNRSGKKWIIPKGIIDPGEDAATAAARECEEESGLIGNMQEQPIGEYEYEKWNTTCHVKVFPMRVTEVRKHWDEEDFRERQWFSVSQAMRKLADEELKAMVNQLVNEL